MKCKLCGEYFFSIDNKGNNTNPICSSCDNKKNVKQAASITGNNNTITQHHGNINNYGSIEKCYFCSKEAVTYCVDCGKPLCESHTHTYFSKGRCNHCHILRGGKAGVNSVVNTVKGINSTMRWLDSLWFR